MKTNCTSFVNILKTLHSENITSKSVLMDNQTLYTEFWFAVKEFCQYALLSKTSGTNNEGEVLPGNTPKIEALVNLGVTTRSELEMDCLIKIIEKLDLVFKEPIEQQKNYCYKICNNVVNDCFRKLPPKDTKIVSFNGTIDSDVVDKDNAHTYEDIIGDNTYNAERIYLEQERIAELSKELKAKRMRERAEKREQILHEIATLSKRPAEVLVRLACTHLEMKPRELSELIIDKGCESAYADVLFKITKKNGIALENIRNIIAGNMVTAESVWADTNNSKKVAEQISRLKGRADKRLQK